MTTPLTMEEVKGFLPGVPVILYKDFATMTDLPFVTVYLFLTKDGFGHWCCVFRRNDEIELFDSYGIPPESEHKFASKHMLQHLKERKSFLLDMCKEKKWSIVHNSTRLQSWHGAETCGRHCIERVRKGDVDIKTYVKWLQTVSKEAKTTPDYVVSFLVE